MNTEIIIRHLGLTDYSETFAAMQQFTQERPEDATDEIWITEHPPVFTQGLAGKTEHLIQPSDIPLIQTDRGGQITYHGPGQIVVYPLINIKRAGIGIRKVVNIIEHSLVNTLQELHIASHTKPEAPGVYIDDKKIASLGLRVRRGCTYHGLAFNFDMDLRPFDYINPCGYSGLKMTQVRDWEKDIERSEVEKILIRNLMGLIQAEAFTQ